MKHPETERFKREPSHLSREALVEETDSSLVWEFLNRTAASTGRFRAALGVDVEGPQELQELHTVFRSFGVALNDLELLPSPEDYCVRVNLLIPRILQSAGFRRHNEEGSGSY